MSWRLLDVDLVRLKASIEEEQQQNTRCLANTLGSSHSTIHTYLKEFGLIEKIGVWVPHDLSHFHEKQHLDTCSILL